MKNPDHQNMSSRCTVANMHSSTLSWVCFVNSYDCGMKCNPLWSVLHKAPPIKTLPYSLCTKSRGTTSKTSENNLRHGQWLAGLLEFLLHLTLKKTSGNIGSNNNVATFKIDAIFWWVEYFTPFSTQLCKLWVTSLSSLYMRFHKVSP